MGKVELKVTAGTADITPPFEVGLLTSAVEGRWAPFTSLRSRLKARVVVLEFGDEKVAVVSLDLLALSDIAFGGWSRFKHTLAQKVSAGFTPNRIILTCTHTHNAPESGAMTDLYRSQPFQDWIEQLQTRVAQAIAEAGKRTTPCTVATGFTELYGFTLQRRIPTPAGIIMSDSVQPIARELLERGPVDHRVRGVFFRDLHGNNIATMVHASCHPVHEMCLPQISADFPGELCQALEHANRCGVPLFLNGAAGDINPTTVSEGAAAAHHHGVALAEALISAEGTAHPVRSDVLKLQSRTIELPMRSVEGVPVAEHCLAHLNGLRIGALALVFVPGELFTEIGLAIEKDSPFEQTIVVGFSESSIGYVPTRRAFSEGGYEIGPGKWSFLCEDAEFRIKGAVSDLLCELMEPASIPPLSPSGPTPARRTVPST
jgi:hypothetical protein